MQIQNVLLHMFLYFFCEGPPQPEPNPLDPCFPGVSLILYIMSRIYQCANRQHSMLLPSSTLDTIHEDVDCPLFTRQRDTPCICRCCHSVKELGHDFQKELYIDSSC